MKQRFCIKCGAELKEGLIFCSRCGHRIKDEKKQKKQTSLFVDTVPYSKKHTNGFLDTHFSRSDIYPLIVSIVSLVFFVITVLIAIFVNVLTIDIIYPTETYTLFGYAQTIQHFVLYIVLMFIAAALNLAHVFILFTKARKKIVSLILPLLSLCLSLSLAIILIASKKESQYRFTPDLLITFLFVDSILLLVLILYLFLRRESEIPYISGGLIPKIICLVISIIAIPTISISGALRVFKIDYSFVVYRLNEDEQSYSVNDIHWDAYYRYPYSDVAILSSFRGLEITGIDDEALSHDGGNYQVKTINLPSSIRTIGKRSFANQHDLTTININSSNFTLGDGAFVNCLSLKSFRLPNGISVIGNSVFSGCSSLKEIYVPSTVSEIGNSAFSACDVDEKSFPNSIVTIGESAFWGCNFTSLQKFQSLKMIGKSAFMFNENLTNVVIPDSVLTIGESAFESCKSLKSIVFPNQLTTINSNVMARCSSLEYVVIPRSVTTIKEEGVNTQGNEINVFYLGTEGEWNQISIGYSNFVNKRYYYSSTPIKDGKHWHYVNDVPTIYV